MKEKAYYCTKEGFEILKQELIRLEQQELPALSQRIGEAKAKGDLKENSEYTAAKHEMVLLKARIEHLKEQFMNAVVISKDDIDTSSVSILTRVKLKNEANGKEVVYELVPSQEANIRGGKISIDSPIGKGLLGKKKGERVVIKVPVGDISYKVMDITL